MLAKAILLFQIFFPVFAGLLVLVRPLFRKNKYRLLFCAAALVLSAAGAYAGLFVETTVFPMFGLTASVRLVLCNDGLARLFCLLVVTVWLFAGFYSFRYLKKTGKTVGFYASYLMSAGVLQAIALSANLVTFYMFYEWMTLLTFPLVLQNKTREAVRAARKYFFFSIAGACLSLTGIFLLAGNTDGLTFTKGGSVLAGADRNQVLLAAVFLLFGFGTKAGMFPLHGWLPVAHPAAPAPASAVLSGVITKVGVLGIIRSLFYVIGIHQLSGTYVQTIFLSVSLLTVFMGSMLAYKEKGLKKRLAYSTVSQVSYILFGIALMTPEGYAAGLMHMLAHGTIKVALFLFAGSVIHETGEERVDGLKGIGQRMPCSLACYTAAALGLIGIPPTIGFMSKWYLATSAMDTEGIGFFAYLGPAVLLVSALLTAGYLLPVVTDGFFPGKGFLFQGKEKVSEAPGREGGFLMFVPLLIFAAAAVVLGIFAEPLMGKLLEIAYGVHGFITKPVGMLLGLVKTVSAGL